MKKSEVQKELELRWKIEKELFSMINENSEERTSQMFPDTIFWVDKNTGEIYIQHDKPDNITRLNYNKIWMVLEKKYSLDHWQVNKILNEVFSTEFLGLKRKTNFVFWGINS